jgi:hypothetical protein
MRLSQSWRMETRQGKHPESTLKLYYSSNPPYCSNSPGERSNVVASQATPFN